MRARYGWESDFPTFSEAEPRVIRISLQEFLTDAGDSQIHAWDDSIPKIQVEVGEVVEIDHLASSTRPFWSTSYRWSRGGPTWSSS